MKKEKSEVPNRYINPHTVSALWGLCAGRCELCNRTLYENNAFGLNGNYAQTAHIHAVSENGPRNVAEMTREECNNLDNLMLLCYDDHKMIDSDPNSFSDQFLVEQKRQHEQRIRNVTGINPKQSCQILTYFCGTTESVDLFHKNLLRQALLYSRKLPMQEVPVALANQTDLRYDPTKDGFLKKAIELERSYRNWNENAGLEKESLAVFSLAPIPLLVKLGILLGDRKNASVFQCHRHGHKWAWPTGAFKEIEYISTRTTPISQGPVALVVDLSAKVDDARITRVLGHDTTIYHVTIQEPNRDFVTSEDVQDRFVLSYRNAMETIKKQHPVITEVHLFPVLPNSLAVRAGMDYMSKTDPSLVIYEQANPQDGFFEALRIGGIDHDRN